jgi:hypothetical protein
VTSCQEHAKQLSQLHKEVKKTSFIGIFKQRSDSGILNFYSNFFRFPIFQDPSSKVFNALGERKWRMLLS